MLIVQFLAEVLTGFTILWYIIMMFDVYVVAQRDNIFLVTEPAITREKDPEIFNDLLHTHRISLMCLGVAGVIATMMIYHDFRAIKLIYWG